MKKILMSLLVMTLCAAMLLSGCNKQSDENLFATTAGGEKTKKPASTTKAPMEEVEMPDSLRTVLEDENQIVSRLTEGNGITVPIYGKETIELTYHGWPTVCKGEDGVLYASASLRVTHVDPFGAVVFYESRDNGETWSDPVIVADTPLDDRDSGIIYLGNNKILVNWFCHDAQFYVDGDVLYTEWQEEVTPQQKAAVINRWNNTDPLWLKGGSFVALSEDGGKTWGEPQRVPVKSPHGMTMGQDGRTLYFFGVLSTNYELSGVSGLKGGYAYLFKSTNYGKIWSQVGKAELPKNLGSETFFDEGYCIQLKDGSFLAGIRTEKSDCGYWTICTTTSKDGREWTYPKPIKNSDGTNLKGSPPHFLQLSNGVILLAYSWRNGNCGSRGRLSYDGGLTWSDEFIICVSDQPGNGDLGYPTTVELADGTLITTYYQAYGNDPHPSLLYTRWRLVESD